MDRVFFIALTIFSIGFTDCTRRESAVDKKSQRLQFLRDNGLVLKELKLDRFRLHFNCDSVLFLKQTFGDTTKIWTASMLSWNEPGELLEKIDRKKFGKSQYINSVAEDGRFELVDMHETTFVKRNDSLYQMSRFINPKLIFHPSMFSNGQQSVKLDKKFNYEGDSIVLGRMWSDNDLKHYYIIVKNIDDGGPTEYSFTFDENLRFIYWEDCNARVEK